MTNFAVSDAGAKQGVSLRQALLLYGVQGEPTSHATVHPVSASGEIGVGRTLRRSAARNIFRDLSRGTSMERGVTPACVLWADGLVCAWWRPATSRLYQFDTDHEPTDGIATPGRRCALAPVPALLYLVVEGHFRIFALDSDARPNDDSPLYCPPFMNCYRDGDVCLGNTPQPQGASHSDIERWENVFWGSVFSHPTTHTVANYPGGLDALSNDLLDGKHARFPLDALITTGFTLGGLLRGIQ